MPLPSVFPWQTSPPCPHSMSIDVLLVVQVVPPLPQTDERQMHVGF